MTEQPGGPDVTGDAPAPLSQDETRERAPRVRASNVATVGGGADDLHLAQTEGGGPPRVHDRAAALDLPARYQPDRHLAGGGQGDVYRIYDRLLRRQLVMKVLGDWWNDDPVARSRFVQEAQVTAQLQHPSIVPVHEIGTLADGRPYYTMAEIRGRTLTAVIEAVHDASIAGWATEPGGYTFRRLVDAFHRVCEAVGYAHTHGVVHRDLKPHNVMIGEFGEVLVLDWGLARIGSTPDAVGAPPSTSRSDDDALVSQAGLVAGTAGYMAPEQLAGAPDLGPPADVYALGMILREILTGLPPGISERLGIATPIVASAARPLPDELCTICARATAAAAGERYPDAGALAAAVASFLDGARKRERARALLDQAEALAPRIAALEAEAAGLTREARAVLDGLPPSAPAAAKEPGWALEDRAHERRVDAELATVEMTRLIDLSLIEAELPEAHRLLAAHLRGLHAAAEARRDPAARTLEVQLRTHDRGEHAAYLAGTGALTLHTEPPAAVELRRFEVRGRRLVDEHVRDLGTAPIRALPLAPGSYLLVLRAPGHHEVRYPVSIGRQEHWNPTRPGERGPSPLVLPRLGSIEPDEIFVPAGPCWVGGDAQAAGEVMPRTRVWVDSFVIRRHPVTSGEVLAMVNALVDERTPEAEELALAVVPRHRGASAGEAGTLIWPRGADGHFSLTTDDEGIVWRPELPAFMINWHGALTYAAWLTRRTGRAYRLPGELEYEKAARGADGRYFPWGDSFDPTWANMRLSHADGLRPVAIDEFPVDESPYGVRGLAGNLCEWTGEEYRREGPPLLAGRYQPPLDQPADAPPAERALRGGCFLFDSFLLRAATRHSSTSILRDVSVGFRLARSSRP